MEQEPQNFSAPVVLILIRSISESKMDALIFGNFKRIEVSQIRQCSYGLYASHH